MALRLFFFSAFPRPMPVPHVWGFSARRLGVSQHEIDDRSDRFHQLVLTIKILGFWMLLVDLPKLTVKPNK